LAFSACKKKERGDLIDEGHIKYEIEYMGDSLDTFIQNFLPKYMRIQFKDNCTRNQVQSMSGLLDLTHIKNFREETNIALVTILDKKYKYIEQLDEPSIFFKERPDLKVEYTEETKTIAGFPCKKIKVTIPSVEEEKRNFDIYYTDKIHIKGFNDHTPFQSVNGVLMEFQLDFYDIPMKFTATEVKQYEIPSKQFEVPKGYKRINKKTMKEIIELLK
jgi:hypothetical protein